MMKKNNKNIISVAAAVFAVCLFFAGCSGNKIENGKKDIYSSFHYVTEENLDKDMQIIELANSNDYYEMEAETDADNVYFYSIGYDSRGKLVDKSVISTMPTGISKGDKVAVNVTLPDTETPAYAVSFISSDKEEKYYILEYDEENHGKMTLVKNREDLMLEDE